MAFRSFFLLGTIMTLFFQGASAADSQLEPGVLKAAFFYPNREAPADLKPLQAHCPSAMTENPLTAIAADVAVSLIGAATDSVIEASAAKMQPEATTLDVTVPLDGFFDERGLIAIHGGCLVVHNGNQPDARDASLLMVLIAVAAPDNTAFRFKVHEWTFKRFLKPKSSQWLQRSDERDFALRIEFLTPSSSGLGNRSVFVEHAFANASVRSLAAAFHKGQQLPWFSVPAWPGKTSAVPMLFFPLNARVTLVETTKPNQFAQWAQALAKEKKSELVALAQDATRKALDPNYAVAKQAEGIDQATAAFNAYKAAWDQAATLKANKPKAPDAGATQAEQDKYAADLIAWKASFAAQKQLAAGKRSVARLAFENAGLSWPGDLPDLKDD